MKHDYHGVPMWLMKEYLADLGAVETGENTMQGDGWQAVVSKAEPNRIGSLVIGGASVEFSGDEDALECMLCPVVRDAADLLTSRELERVGRCADERCGWLFVDTSRNRSRRWCSMESCGNRAKARRHYRKSRD